MSGCTLGGSSSQIISRFEEHEINTASARAAEIARLRAMATNWAVQLCAAA